MIEFGRGAVAVLAGYALMALLVMVSDRLLVAYFPGADGLPSGTYMTGSLLCAFLAAAAGGWATMRLAVTRPLLHILALAGVILALGLYLVLSGASPAGQPGWHRVAILALGVGGVGLGGLLGGRGAAKPV